MRDIFVKKNDAEMQQVVDTCKDDEDWLRVPTIDLPGLNITTKQPWLRQRSFHGGIMLDLTVYFVQLIEVVKI